MSFVSEGRAAWASGLATIEEDSLAVGPPTVNNRQRRGRF